MHLFVETYNFTYSHVKSKPSILELEGISASTDTDFFFLNVGCVTGNYNVRRNLDRLSATEENKASLFGT